MQKGKLPATGSPSRGSLCGSGSLRGRRNARGVRMRRLRKEVRVGLIGSMAVVAGLAGVLTFATAASAKKKPRRQRRQRRRPCRQLRRRRLQRFPAPRRRRAQPAGLRRSRRTPGTCLTGGTSIAITGSGYDPKSLGIVLQCNNDPSQPEVFLGGLVNENVPVSCTGIALANAITTSSTGGFSATWSAIDGQTGPPCGKAGDLVNPCPATDTTGGDPTTDAATYPCPPTPSPAGGGGARAPRLR